MQETAGKGGVVTRLLILLSTFASPPSAVTQLQSSTSMGRKGGATSEEILCSRCGAELRPTDRVCESCGASQELACAHCGARCERGSRFCPTCGSELAICSEQRPT